MGSEDLPKPESSKTTNDSQQVQNGQVQNGTAASMAAAPFH